MSFLNFSEANCKNCYKCLRHCPVKAIKIKDEQAQIVEDKCIGCSECLVICPQNARQIKSSVANVKRAIVENKRVIATIAPSFIGGFNLKDAGQMVTALKKLGFNHVEETAIGAEVIATLYKNYINSNDQKNYITTCCPAANNLIEKYYPSLIEYMLPMVSPMVAHGKLIREYYGHDSYVVFIGPCTAKKIEAADVRDEGVIDAVLTFEEMEVWFEEEGIKLDALLGEAFDSESFKKGSSFPVGGGVLSSFIDDNSKLDVIAVSGIKECMDLFDSVEKGQLENYCIEVNVCKGSCIGGMAMPKNDESIFVRKERVKNYVKDKKDISKKGEFQIPKNIDYGKYFFEHKVDFDVADEEIEKVLNRMGKYKLEDELNCGGCGYNTCREKAKAVVLGMAEINMCLPFMRGKAESLKNLIFENSPNAIMLVDNNMLIKEINPMVEKIFDIEASRAKNSPLSMLIDDKEFIEVRDTKKNIIKRKAFYPSHNVVLLQNIIYVEKQNVLLAIMVDITKEEKSKGELSKVKESTLDAAQKVIEKQMRVAQEIASLLGETTAETKSTLTKLKNITIGEKGDL
ncbi:[Fe-Fe] hydrogenase large subunit C-terminal domain-containing protein [Dethiothermospora halolimnae]|uniref:[Fe-Fe] hydrogenase large subunit C-terminal domain-containing protein n=1 Tax=Dethiothermospora halolimnae TaxID=3114390 RepID=UPI003CCB7EDB